MASICACLSLHFLAHAQRVSARGLRPRPGRWTPGIFSGVLSLVPAAALINAVEDVPRRVLAIPALLPLLQIPLTVAAIKGLSAARRGAQRVENTRSRRRDGYALLLEWSRPDSHFGHPQPHRRRGFYRSGRDSGDRPVCRDLPHRPPRAIGYPPTLLSLGPEGAGCIDAGLAEGSKRGHLFEYVSSVDDAGLGPRFTVTARPRNYGHTGGRSFLIDETGVIRGTSAWNGSRAATPEDPPL